MTTHIETAPEHIWLQISDSDVDAAFSFPENTSDVTWGADSVVAVEVKYVRADLAEQQRDKLPAALERLLEGTMSMPNRGRATEGKWTTINALTSSVDSAKAAIAAAKAHE